MLMTTLEEMEQAGVKNRITTIDLQPLPVGCVEELLRDTLNIRGVLSEVALDPGACPGVEVPDTGTSPQGGGKLASHIRRAFSTVVGRRRSDDDGASRKANRSRERRASRERMGSGANDRGRVGTPDSIRSVDSACQRDLEILTDVLYNKTAGNPFFIIQVGACLFIRD